MIERNGSGFLAYIGTYADADSDGIHIYGFDAASGALEKLGGGPGGGGEARAAGQWRHTSPAFVYSAGNKYFISQGPAAGP